MLTVQTAISPLQERLAALESTVKSLDGIRDRVVVLETKSATPTHQIDSAAVREHTKAVIGEIVQHRIDEMSTYLKSISDVMGMARERLAALEARAPVAGPAGAPGRDGVNGADGLGFEDIVFEHDGERTITAKGVRGDRMKALGTFVVPVDIYRGVFTEGKTYERGDGVTWGGSEWHCHETTTSKPGEGSKAWTLKVQRGRDGKDGKDAPGALPVVRVS